MDKLQARESHNLRNLKLRKVRGDMVGEYTGYGRKAVRCEPNGKVGTLVYHEYLYRKAGKNRGAALKSKAKAVQAVEVMEIFRFDGKAWKY